MDQLAALDQLKWEYQLAQKAADVRAADHDTVTSLAVRCDLSFDR
ncbi:hypothetical protein [Arthrobacter flavus]